VRERERERLLSFLLCHHHHLIPLLDLLFSSLSSQLETSLLLVFLLGLVVDEFKSSVNKTLINIA
jgi:hypothetical protein